MTCTSRGTGREGSSAGARKTWGVEAKGWRAGAKASMSTALLALSSVTVVGVTLTRWAEGAMSAVRPPWGSAQLASDAEAQSLRVRAEALVKSTAGKAQIPLLAVPSGALKRGALPREAPEGLSSRQLTLLG